jgi:hypothetical protein
VNRAAAEPTNEHLDLDKLLEAAMAQRAATLKPEHPNSWGFSEAKAEELGEDEPP